MTRQSVGQTVVQFIIRVSYVSLIVVGREIKREDEKKTRRRKETDRSLSNVATDDTTASSRPIRLDLHTTDYYPTSITTTMAMSLLWRRRLRRTFRLSSSGRPVGVSCAHTREDKKTRTTEQKIRDRLSLVTRPRARARARRHTQPPAVSKRCFFACRRRTRRALDLRITIDIITHAAVKFSVSVSFRFCLFVVRVQNVDDASPSTTTETPYTMKVRLARQNRQFRIQPTIRVTRLFLFLFFYTITFRGFRSKQTPIDNRTRCRSSSNRTDLRSGRRVSSARSWSAFGVRS